ncbi:MAG: hypothetical protein RRA15_01485 [bacterium]|nr:hypothetical protein [bacterium]MDT8365151.1 hypothetical protein [bacterium]
MNKISAVFFLDRSESHRSQGDIKIFRRKDQAQDRAELCQESPLLYGSAQKVESDHNKYGEGIEGYRNGYEGLPGSLTRTVYENYQDKRSD